MLQSHFFTFIVSTILGYYGDIIVINGASLGELERQHASIQDVKDYIQPIIYQKFLRAPGDSPVIQQAKTVVSEYLVDTLLDSAQNPVYSRPEHFGRQATTGTGSRPSISSISSLIRNVTRPTPSPEHVINQVDHILNNVNGGNITGIVDQALLIRAPPGVRQLVNGIMSLVLCNPFNRLWNRCPGGGSLIFGSGR